MGGGPLSGHKSSRAPGDLSGCSSGKLDPAAVFVWVFHRMNWKKKKKKCPRIARRGWFCSPVCFQVLNYEKPQPVGVLNLSFPQTVLAFRGWAPPSVHVNADVETEWPKCRNPESDRRWAEGWTEWRSGCVAPFCRVGESCCCCIVAYGN